MEESDKETIFWADKLAEKIVNRKRFHYTDDKIKKQDEFVVKTSASLSGVLHIGRLSDTIRGDSVFRALKDLGVKAKLIWVAEDMDPLRKIPEGVPKSFSDYIGVPVSDIPDFYGCHKSYSEHFMSEYLEVIDSFVHNKMEKFSMRSEYKNGSFKPFIKRIVENFSEVKSIVEKYRDEPLPRDWAPWKPVCKNCGKIATTKIVKIENNKIHYVCEDYDFKTTKAKGCGYKGVADPLNDDGKLMWKSEWAAQWAHWNICCEGAGKEYQVPTSAFWINGEICERILKYPMPEPIFYEHLMIDNVKMSASLGNVIYPKDWLEVAPPEILRFFYNKRLMKTRSFSWKNLPLIYDEFDDAQMIYFGIKKLDNEKEEENIKRLYEISALKIEKPLLLSFNHSVLISQIFNDENKMLEALKKTGHYQKEFEERILQRLRYAKKWVFSYAPKEYKFELQKEPKAVLKENEKEAVKQVIEILRRGSLEEAELHKKFYEIAEKNNMKTQEFFSMMYRILLDKERGPKLANFLLSLGENGIEILERAVNKQQ
ncbi:MAG: lysine--tRNA ligase [Candidatus Woesearchaeota archaeon]